VGEDVPAELRAFLYSCIHSVEQAEMVVRLHESEGAFPARTLARQLGIADAAARHHLETLVARGLLQTAVGGEVFYRYAPRSPELQRFAAQLIEWWGHSRSAVLRAIAMRPQSLASFSDAFKLRKEDE
jgi:predicted DNA-binding transcriptional regulator